MWTKTQKAAQMRLCRRCQDKVKSYFWCSNCGYLEISDELKRVPDYEVIMAGYCWHFNYNNCYKYLLEKYRNDAL